MPKATSENLVADFPEYIALGKLLQYTDTRTSKGRAIDIKGFGSCGDYFYLDLFHPLYHNGTVVRILCNSHLNYSPYSNIDLAMMIAASGIIESFITQTPDSSLQQGIPTMQYLCKEQKYDEQIPLHVAVNNHGSNTSDSTADGKRG